MNRLQKVSASSAGSIVVLLAISITCLIAFVGLAIDGGYIYLQYSKMARAADAAALAAALKVPDLDAAKIEADTISSWNGFTNGVDDTTVSTYVKSDANRVYVTVAKKQKMFFVTVLGIDHFNMSATAAALAEFYYPLGVEVNGIYGVNGVQYLCAWGYNIVEELGGYHSGKWHTNGAINPDYAAEGYDYELYIPPDYAAKNGTNLVSVDIYDADCWNLDLDVTKREENPRRNIDEIYLKTDTVNGKAVYSDGHPPSNLGYTTTIYTVYAPDGSKIAEYVWKEGLDPFETDLKWYTPDGFVFDTAGFAGQKYRINVKTLEGTSCNVYQLRSGPPLSEGAGELSGDADGTFDPTGHVFTLEFEHRKWNAPGDVRMMVNGHASNNYFSGGNAFSTDFTPIDITEWVNSSTIRVQFNHAYDTDNTVRNIVVKMDGVPIGAGVPLYSIDAAPVVMFNLGADDLPGTADDIVDGVGGGGGLFPTYHLSWEGKSWDEPYEVAVVFNAYNIDWESTQGTTTNFGIKTYQYDVTNYMGGDTVNLTFINNNHVPPGQPAGTHIPAEVQNAILTRRDPDGSIHQVASWYTGGWHVLGALPEENTATGVGVNSGWGAGTQFDPDNGSTIKSSGLYQLLEMNRTSGQSNNTIGYIPPEYADSTVVVRGIDNYSGRRWLDFYDSNGTVYPSTKPEQGTTPVKTAYVPLQADFTGGALYTEYPAGSEPRSSWLLGTVGSDPIGRRRVRLVE